MASESHKNQINPVFLRKTGFICRKTEFNACGSCDVKTAYLKRGGMNNEALGGSNWVVSANFILLQANEESQFL